MLIGDVTGAASMASDLATAVTPDAVWSQITPFAGFIGTTILIAIGVKVVRKLTRRTSNLKGGM